MCWFQFSCSECLVCVLLGMCESIIAAAFSRIGWRVLHLDRWLPNCCHLVTQVK